MAENPIEEVAYQHTMQRLESLRRGNDGEPEFWMARDIMGALGYDKWANFEGVVSKARAAIDNSSVEPSHHIADAGKMVGIGSGTSREVRDYYLSRLACYLIAMNGDPHKPEIAAAQAYFAIKTRTAELADEQSDDEKRVAIRAKVSASFKKVSGVAKEAGVPSNKQALFHDARYQGLYGMSRRDLMGFKGIGPAEQPFDRMGALELSANDFQMNLAAETLKDEGVKGEVRAIAKNKEIAKRVRQTMIDSGSPPPEKLPVAEPIKQVERRLKTQAKLTKGDPAS